MTSIPPPSSSYEGPPRRQSKKKNPSSNSSLPSVSPILKSPAVEGDEHFPFPVQAKPPATRAAVEAYLLGVEALAELELSTKDFKLLMPRGKVHHALLAYEDFKISKDIVIILATDVFDGVGDLEHLIHAARHLLALRAQEPFKKLVVFLRRKSKKDVPEKAWLAKIKTLEELRLDGVFFLDDSEPDKTRAAWSALLELQKEKRCLINISTESELPVIEESEGEMSLSRDDLFLAEGCICEYRIWGFELEQRLRSSGLESLPTGFVEGGVGLWMKADPAFHTASGNLSLETKQLLFGSDWALEEDWDVGVASLREDFARLAWINLRLAQVPKTQNCALSVSSFRDSALEHKEIAKLASLHKFSRCILVNPQGDEEVVLEGTLEGRTLRVVHVFISEAELPILIQLARSGSLGGAGDTACTRGLLGDFPVFIECRPDFEKRWEEAAKYLTSRGFTRVAKWIQGCLAQERVVQPAVEGQNQAFYSLAQLMTPALVWEWKKFRSHVQEELEIGRWVDLYVRRCVAISGKSRFQIQGLEIKYCQERLSEEEYTAGIKKALETLRL